MISRCSLRFSRGQDRRRGGWWESSVSYSILSFFLCLQAGLPGRGCRACGGGGVPGCPAQLLGDAVAEDVATLGSVISLRILCPWGNCTLGSLGACSLRVGDAFCGRCYDLMEVTGSLDGVSDGGARSAVGGKVVVYYYREISSFLVNAKYNQFN